MWLIKKLQPQRAQSNTERIKKSLLFPDRERAGLLRFAIKNKINNSLKQDKSIQKIALISYALETSFIYHLGLLKFDLKKSSKK